MVMTKRRQKYTATKCQRYTSENKADEAERITIDQMVVCAVRGVVFPLHSIPNPQSK